MLPMPLRKIVVIGPESTGKSTLCRQLAAHYNTEWVKEYARGYLLENGKRYVYDDLAIIAKGQLEKEDGTVNRLGRTDKNLVFIDTDMYVMKVWSEFVFNKCDNSILTEIAKRKYDLYLLCDIDLPWEPDELREYPDLESRQKLFHFYKDALINQHVPWRLIRGEESARVSQAIQLIDEFIRCPI
jgi:NadR type nicotinamide-nucleotide adenylyltransferase